MKSNLLFLLLLSQLLTMAQVTVFDNLPTSPRSLFESNSKLYTRLNVEIRVWDNLPQNTDNVVVSSSAGNSDGFIVENDILYYTDENADNVVRWDLINATQTTIGNNFMDGINPDHITIVNGIIYITVEATNNSNLKLLLFYDNNSDSFFVANGLGNGDITGIKANGTDIYILKRSGQLLRVDVSNFNFSVNTINNVGSESFGLEIENDIIYYTSQFSGELKSVSKTIVNDTPQTVATGLSLPTDVKKIGTTFYISDNTGNTVYTYEQPCNVTIPDTNFKTALLNHGTTITGTNIGVIDANGDGEIQCAEAAAYTGKLALNFQSINDLTGLEAFTATTNIDLSDNPFTSIDISALTGLVEFKANFILASTIDFSGLTNLEIVTIESGALTSVTFANNSSLRILNLNGSQLITIDLTSLTSLEELDLRSNQITTLDVTQNTSLVTINVRSNNLTNINLTQNTTLTDLSLGFNNLSSIDLSQNTLLNVLELANNNLSGIDLSQNTALTFLDLTNNNLSSIDLSQNTVLTDLYLNTNNFSNVNLSQNTALVYLDLEYNSSLSSIDLSQNINLLTLVVNNTGLTSLNVSQNILLEELQLSDNTNFSTAIDFSNNSNLKYVYINDTQLTDIDLSANGILEEIELTTNNSLANVNVANGNNANISFADFSSSPALTCIQIDNGFTPPASDWFNDASASYSSNCSALSVDDNLLNTPIKIYPNPAIDQLYIVTNKEIESVSIYSLLGQKILKTNSKTVNVRGLKTGMYIVNIETTAGSVSTQRFIKK